MTTINKKAYFAPNAQTFMVNAKQMISTSILTPDGTNDISVTPTSSPSDYDGEFFARESVFDW